MIKLLVWGLGFRVWGLGDPKTSQGVIKEIATASQRIESLGSNL